LSVPRYQAISVGRGANLDTIDAPLSDGPWLRRQFQEIRALPGEAERLAAIDALLDWTHPGPGGFYDELGNPQRRPHLVPGTSFAEDPDYERSWRVGFTIPGEARLAWTHFAESLYDAPLTMRYTGLDPHACYCLRVLYGSERTRARVRLDAGDGIEVHGYLDKPYPPRPLEFELPEGAVRDGQLTLVWRREPGLGGNGRGCQVSEVWLLRDP